MSDEGQDGGHADERSDRVKGERHEGPIPLKDVLRIVLIGIPVMVVAWYFLVWLKGGFR